MQISEGTSTLIAEAAADEALAQGRLKQSV
jgi:hypothetical protein